MQQSGQPESAHRVYKMLLSLLTEIVFFFKYACIGVNGKMYRAIASIYNSPKSRIVLGDHSTKYFDCPIGVKQGCCLSPTLFSIFINDIVSIIKDSKIGLKIYNNPENERIGASPDLILNKFTFGAIKDIPDSCDKKCGGLIVGSLM